MRTELSAASCFDVYEFYVVVDSGACNFVVALKIWKVVGISLFELTANEQVSSGFPCV